MASMHPESALPANPPPVVTVVGGSMEPTLPRGCAVRVVPADAPPDPGDLVLIRGSEGWIVHRVVHRCTFAGCEQVFHRGDRQGGIGFCPASAVAGRVIAVIGAEGRSLPPPAGLPAHLCRALGRARLRCRLFALCRRAGIGLPAPFGRSGGGIRAALGRTLRRALLGCGSGDRGSGRENEPDR